MNLRKSTCSTSKLSQSTDPCIKLDSTPTSIEFSPNSERVAIGTIQGKVIVYDMVGKQVTIKLHDHTNAISCVTFDHAERILATASWDKLGISLQDVFEFDYHLLTP